MQLDQKQLFKGFKRYVLSSPEEDVLKVSIKAGGAERDFDIHLRDLDPRPVRARERAIAPWIGVFIFGGGYIALVVAIVIGLSYDTLGSRIWLSAICGAFIVPFALVFTVKAVQGTYNVTTFFSRWNGQPLVCFSNVHPSCEEVAAFVAELTRRVEKAAPPQVLGDGLADQLARLEELRGRSILSDTEFAAAKHRLLAGTEERRIGFQS